MSDQRDIAILAMQKKLERTESALRDLKTRMAEWADKCADIQEDCNILRGHTTDGMVLGIFVVAQQTENSIRGALKDLDPPPPAPRERKP